MADTKKPSSGLATAGLVLGICACVFCWVPGIHFILAALAIIFGAVAYSKRFGKASLILGIASYFPFLIFFLLALIGSAGVATY